jgi:SGNH domain-containing protein
LPASCTWQVKEPTGTILLIGDSNAGHLTEPMIETAKAMDMNLEVATASGCPFLILKHYLRPECERFVTKSISAISSREPAYSFIVISNFSVGYVNGEFAGVLAQDTPTGPLMTNKDRAIASWTSAFEATLIDAKRRSPVLAIGAVPRYDNFPSCLKRSIMLGPTASCGIMSPAFADQQRRQVISAERDVTGKLGVRYFDTASELCSASRGCSVYAGGVLAYRDGGHLSIRGSYLFVPGLRAALARPSATTREAR